MLSLGKWKLGWILTGTLGLLSVIGAGLAAGIRAQKIIFEQPTADMAFGVDSLSNDGLLVFAREIANAKSEVVVCAHQLSSERILTALTEAAAKGRRVRVLLDGVQYPDPSRGARAFLAKSPRVALRVTDKPLFDQFIVIDGTWVYWTAAPWSPAVANKSVEASAIVIRNFQASSQMLRRFELLFRGGTTSK